jgi:putative transcriptional regulator
VTPTLIADANCRIMCAMPSSNLCLANQLLIAMPALADPNFSQTVALVCEHTDKGALGIVLNRPLGMRLGEVFDQLRLDTASEELQSQPVLRGGPVQTDRGFVIHRPAGKSWDSTLEVSQTLHVTTSRDVLAALARGEGPEQAVVALGYAGWDAGQLEVEMQQNAWLNAPVDESILFDLPFEQRWLAAGRLLGVDIGRLSHLSGRA